MTADVILTVENAVGFITLNRPQALNALNLNMIRIMNDALAQWAADDAVRAVVVRGAGDRAFCAGGDVKTVAQDIRADAGSSLARDFFREEYTLNHRIYTFPKPYIALIDGIVMGGGKGISAHGSHRIVTEKTMFAMPETNIGFFPDVGGGYFLPRCPGQTGVYLALTSHRIGAADAFYIGFATHVIASADVAGLTAALVADGGADVDGVIARFAAPAPDGELATVREAIDRCFAHDAVEDIAAALENENSDWARQTLQQMAAMSPTSLKVALAQIRRGAGMDFAAVMTMEYRLSQRLTRHHDFYEGIRAALIDKDRKPQWSPAKLADIDGKTVESYFDSLGDNDLVLS